MPSTDVVGLGESSVDYVHIVPELPGPEVSKVRISSHFIACGGQVATSMAACAALGLRASYLGPVGNDDNGRRVRTELEARGAGDVFRAAAIYALLQRWTTEELLRFANTAAALSCTRSGAIASVPTLPEVRAALT